MVNIEFELERLRTSLQAKGIPDALTSDICRRAQVEIGMAITDAMADALQQAAQAGEELDANEFISELKAVAFSEDFYISTESGNLNFSEPPYPMMANLLRNPKVAKDGTLYKVIPVSSGSGKSKDTALTDVQASINAARKDTVDSTSYIQTASSVAFHFSGSFAAHKNSQRERMIKKKTADKKSSGDVRFRTATSKQDPTKQWVLPAKDKDMTNQLAAINFQLRETIDDIIVSVVNRYEENT